ncbi:MAG TPA: DNA polymerase III subunit delta' C-terminal domain-containing protein [Syntrophomonas sp.]|nr:DNA polymerase III subunit delta' C-terminal domain-containing protein [Syntrophomonas sp.]
MNYFSNIIGQERAVLPLQRALQSGHISHAYLFWGLAGIGKFTAALEFARALIISSDPQGEAYWREGVHPDFKLIEKADKKSMIGIEQVTNEIEPWLALKPYRARRRAVIIKDAHLLSLPAANALLKTLEEPPEYAVIILVADENNLLETIISRCQVIKFDSLREEDLTAYLTGQGMESAKAGNLARLAQGSIATALLFAEEEWNEFWELAKNLMKSLAAGQPSDVFLAAEKIEKHPLIMVSLLETILRDICVYQQTANPEQLLMAQNLTLCQKFKRLHLDKVGPALGSISSMKKMYNRSVNPVLLNINISYALQAALR